MEENYIVVVTVKTKSSLLRYTVNNIVRDQLVGINEGLITRFSLVRLVTAENIRKFSNRDAITMCETINRYDTSIRKIDRKITSVKAVIKITD